MHLPEFKSVFDTPTTEIEKFLAEPISTAQYVDHFSLVYARIATTIAQLTADLGKMKLDKLKWETKKRRQLMDQVEAGTEKHHTMASADRIIAVHDVMLDYKLREIEYIRRIGILKAYADAMEMKNTVMPGEQGRLNRERSAAGRAHREGG